MDDIYPIKYLDYECLYCHRGRVEVYNDGSEICEKCHYNQKTLGFEDELFKYI